MPVTWTNTQIINNLLRAGVMWSGSTISYGFPASAPSWSFSTGEGPGFSALTAAQKDAARLAIKLWDDLIAPDFVETTSPANVTFQNTTTNIGYAHAYYPGGGSASGSVWFNRTYDASWGTNDLVTPQVGQWGFQTYMHELGHALGLAHPGNYNGGNPTYQNDALYAQDSIMYTVMSYFNASNTGADWRASDGNWYYAQTPMLHDILAIQALYGAEMNTRAGDTRYGFNSNTGVTVFDFTQNAHPILTIWDGGGNDWLDLSGFATASRIDLNPGTFSDCDGMTMNVAIAYACDIENAAGGSASDSITGNALANILQGNAGNDTLNGGAGDDRLEGGTGNDVLRGGAGADILLGGDGDDIFYADIFDNLLQFDGGAGYDILYFYGIPTISFAYADYGFEEMWLLDSSNIIDGTSGADVLTGTDLDETINGFAGNDTLDGGLGNDIIWAGDGNDNVKGGGGDDLISGDAGNDTLDGGLGLDTVSYRNATAGVTVNLALTTAQNTVG
ncbi:MAG: M10 family metallopeptidase, partial [Aestuariivirga sp.]